MKKINILFWILVLSIFVYLFKTQTVSFELNNRVLAVTGATIVLDPGHGCPDYDTNQHKTEEGCLNLEVAQKVQDKLKQQGVDAKLTWDTTSPITPPDHYDSLQERVNRINAVGGVKLFVSIHFDSSASPTGPRSYYNPDRPFSSSSHKLSGYVSSSIVKTTGDSSGKNTDLDSALGNSPGPAYILGPQGTRTDPRNPASVIDTPTNIPGIINEFFTFGRSYASVKNDGTLTDQIAQGYADGIIACINDPSCSTGENSSSVPTQSCAQTVTGSTFYCQKDIAWGAYPSADECDLGYAGCGPTTIAMVLARSGIMSIPSSSTWGSAKVPASAVGQQTIPPRVDDIFRENGWRTCASSMGSVWPWLHKIGFLVTGLGVSGKQLNINEVDSFIRKGYKIIASITIPNSSLSEGHIFGIENVDSSKNQFRVFDPINCAKDKNGNYISVEGPNIHRPNSDFDWAEAVLAP